MAVGVLWFGGNIYTMENEGESAEALYTEGNIIKAVGTYQSIQERFSGRIDQEINLLGKTVLPGFVDSHLHLIGHGEKLLRLDLSQMSSKQEVLEALGNRTANLSEGEWLIGDGWNENQWMEPAIIHKSEIDAVAPDNPVMLTRICRHALLANSKAIALAGIDRHTADPESGIIVRDEQGETTGYFHDGAQDLIRNVMPEVQDSYLERVIRIAVDDLRSKGLVGAHTEDLFYYNGYKRTLDAFRRSIGHNNKFKAHLLVHHEVMDDMIADGGHYAAGNEYVELGAIKVFADGALGGRTAWLIEEFTDDAGNHGVPMHTREGLASIVKRARNHGMPVAIHAIGDMAAKEVVDILEQYPPSNGVRDRLIHGQILHEDTIQKLRKLEAVIDIQPTFVASDFPWVIERIGEERASNSYAWKTLLQLGIECAGGSDAPVEKVEPLLGIEAAVLRKSYYDGKVYGKDERLTVFEAIRLYTAGSAYVIGREHDRGLIKSGFRADFTILDEDIFQVPAEEIHSIPVSMTVVDGEIVYSRHPLH